MGDEFIMGFIGIWGMAPGVIGGIWGIPPPGKGGVPIPWIPPLLTAPKRLLSAERLLEIWVLPPLFPKGGFIPGMGLPPGLFMFCGDGGCQPFRVRASANSFMLKEPALR